MKEIYEDLDKLVLQFVKDGTDQGLATTGQIINGCYHTGWKPKQVKEVLEKLQKANIIDKKNTGEWFVVRENNSLKGKIDCVYGVSALDGMRNND